MLGLRLQPLSLVPTPRHCWPQEKRGGGGGNGEIVKK